MKVDTPKNLGLHSNATLLKAASTTGDKRKYPTRVAPARRAYRKPGTVRTIPVSEYLKG